ncbi:C6 finger domain protein [Aspergillus flavus AF70]|nr:C6 finger domain protein [Aspergillus flavus AF70]
MDSATLNKIRSRRSHHKSRLGCKNCKRRRVKPRGYELLCQNVPQHATDMRQCDEKKPSCGNCVNHSIECDFSVSTPTSPSPSPPAASSAHQRYRFRQSKYQTLASPAPNEAQRPGGNSIAVQCDFSANISAMVGISFADLQLFHHYLISTYRTLTDEASDPYDVWSIHIPQWGIAFPSILHLMLALSALHLGHEKPELRHQYVMQANDHFTFGIRSVTTVLSQLNSENCQLIYMSAVMICLVYFGHGPRPGEYLVFSSQGKAEWLVLMRGVRSILATNHDKIFSGVLTPQTDDSIQSVSPELQGELRQHHDRIVELKTFIEIQTAGPEKDLYLSAVGSLPDTFDETYTMRSAGKDGVCLLPMVIGWIYRLPEPFVVLLEKKDPFALVILAQWSILLTYMTSSWLFVGWDQHVIKGIRASLEEDFYNWISWPETVISPRA